MKNINKFLLSLIILSLSFGQLLRFRFFSFLPSFYLHDLFLVLFLFVNFPQLIHLPFSSFNKKTLLFLVLLFILNPNHLLSLRLAVYWLSFLVLRHLDLDRNFLLNIVKLSFILAVVCGLVQYFFLPDLRVLANLGWDDHLNRLTFPYFDPNFTGIVLVLAFFFFWPTAKIMSLAFIFPLVLTYSRSAWLTWLLVILFKLKKRGVWLVSVFIFILVFLLPHRFGEGNNLFRTYSIKSRISYDLEVCRQIFKHPLKGSLISKYHSLSEFNRSQTANNSFIYLWQIGGLFVLLSFFWLLVDLVKNSHLKDLWLAIIIASFFNNVLFYPFILSGLLILEALKDSTST